MIYEYLAFFALGFFAGALPLSWFAFRAGFYSGVNDMEYITNSHAVAKGTRP